MRLLPRDDAGAVEAGPLDFVGLVLAAAGMVGITYGLSESETAGSLTASSVLLPVLAGLVLLVAFVVRSRRDRAAPARPQAVSPTRPSAPPRSSRSASARALFGAMILIPLYFQTVRGEDAISTACC